VINYSCNCQTTSYYKRPGGKIILKDTELGDEGVRRVKVRTTKYRWGFIWRNTDTNDEGCWNINSNYDVKRAKVQVVFKDRVSDRAVIRSFRGARFWNAFLEAVDFTWYLTRNDRRWNNLCLRIEDDNDNTSLNEQTFVAATTSNAVHEFYDDHSSFTSFSRTSILIHTLSGSMNAAPMFRKLDQQTISLEDVSNFMIAFSNPFTGVLYAYWQASKPDVFISFGDDDPSDQKKETVYHEMAHVVQFDRLGRDWWIDYIRYITEVGLENILTGSDNLYGDGSRPDAGLPRIAEGLAYPIGEFMAGQQYGVNHSLGGVNGRNAWARTAERKNFHLASTNFIPRGIFYDLFDGPSFPTNVPIGSETIPGMMDQVQGILFEEQYAALDPFVRTVSQFKTRLVQNNTTGNRTLNIENVFSAYGH
jgi:hypothetical protein